jgi:flagellar basal-body rod protein FlgB
MIDALTNSSAIPVLERAMQFAGQRHRLITNNIANLSTPGFRPQDVSVAEFQSQLASAIDARRAAGDSTKELPLRSTEQVEVTPDELVLHPEAAADNILFHDGNDRDVERIMQDLVENFMTFRATAQLLKNRFELLNMAIRERM